MKIGDVNESAAANAGSNPIETRTAQRFELATTNHNFAAGQSVEVPVYVSHDVDVAGFQFTVNFDTDLFSLEAINSPMVGINDSNFGLTKLANGAITVSYNRDAAFEVQEGNNILVLTFKAKANGSIDQAMWINSAVTKAEAYNADLHVMNVSFEVQERTNDVVILHQNTPNPFKSVTTIAFELPEAAAATLTVYDVTGKVVKVISNNFNKGYNSIELDRTDLGTSGVMYYTLESGDFKATRKMIVIE
ncbi:MAG: T9SS type A sorting domain-containing protein [Chitinophagales bacterium]|nr:T9SS type A sorting domain-containing protein [Chitinophagales bacterium]